MTNGIKIEIFSDGEVYSKQGSIDDMSYYLEDNHKEEILYFIEKMTKELLMDIKTGVV